MHDRLKTFLGPVSVKDRLDYKAESNGELVTPHNTVRLRSCFCKVF